MKLSAHDLRRLSVEEKRDPRTVSRFIDNPNRVKSTARASIEEAIARLGFAPLLKNPSP